MQSQHNRTLLSDLPIETALESVKEMSGTAARVGHIDCVACIPAILMCVYTSYTDVCVCVYMYS